MSGKRINLQEGYRPSAKTGQQLFPGKGYQPIPSGADAAGPKCPVLPPKGGFGVKPPIKKGT